MTKRVTAKKTITLPSGQTCAVPVISEISFVDPVDRYQETHYTVDNSLQPQRKVHVDQVVSSNDQSSSIPVERVDTWKVKDTVDRSQETDFSFDNTTTDGNIPPSFTTHLKTHVVRYYQDPSAPDDGGIWIDSELIDECHVKDSVDRSQETDFTLVNPQAGPAAQLTGGEPDITNGTEGFGGNPVRLDPFQNIVDFNDNQPEFYISIDPSASFATTGAGTDTGVTNGIAGHPNSGPYNDPPDGPLIIPAGEQYNNTYLSAYSFSFTSTGVLHGQGVGAGPPVSGGSSGAPGALEYVGIGINAGFVSIASGGGPGGNVVAAGFITGPPLVINGKIIPNVVDTLSFTMDITAVAFTSAVTGDTVFNYNIPGGTYVSGTWYRYSGGYYDNFNQPTIGSFTVSVSSTPFRFTAGTHTGMYQAVGLYDNDGSIWFGTRLGVYCVYVGP